MYCCILEGKVKSRLYYFISEFEVSYFLMLDKCRCLSILEDGEPSFWQKACRVLPKNGNFMGRQLSYVRGTFLTTSSLVLLKLSKFSLR